MDKFEFMKVVDDVYGECKTEEEIASRMKQMLDCVNAQGQLAMGHLKAGILGKQD
ncbi:hypothetical protein [uncultured Bacteroides sp.]|uniref:hypothetical protein n=1 Tax=uncultured Bacteroides sp. TaxID=162156 RepID=UPI0026314526|nr:hypothetical protein [uncultured Bacteroides sp.]